MASAIRDHHAKMSRQPKTRGKSLLMTSKKVLVAVRRSGNTGCFKANFSRQISYSCAKYSKVSTIQDLWNTVYANC